MSRRQSYITTQLSAINSQLQGLFEELGLGDAEREVRERDVYSVIATALENHVNSVVAERDTLSAQCSELQQGLRSMLTAMSDVDAVTVLGSSSARAISDDVAPPYKPLHRILDESNSTLESLLSDRLVQVNGLLEQLKDLACRVDGITVPSNIMPAQRDDLQSLDLSRAHITELETEVHRWKQEEQSRIATVADCATQIVALWAELGTPQADIDRRILECYKTNPQELGTLCANMDRLKAKLAGLQQEKDARVDKLTGLKKDVGHLWTKLSEDSQAVAEFERGHRGLGLSVLQAYQVELDRLNEKKRQHIHIFIQDARHTLHLLWDKLYMSEQETALFTPAWADIYTDASLDAHETEIARLEKLVEERAPVLALIEARRQIQADEEALEASSHDASRLLSKGPGRREPGRLLKEEQMRKRIAKHKPKILHDLHVALVDWETKSGQPFYVNGTRFLDTIVGEEQKCMPRATPRRPLVPASSTRQPSPAKSTARMPVTAPSVQSVQRRPPVQQPNFSRGRPAPRQAPATRIPARRPAPSDTESPTRTAPRRMAMSPGKENRANAGFANKLGRPDLSPQRPQALSPKPLSPNVRVKDHTNVRTKEAPVNMQFAKDQVPPYMSPTRGPMSPVRTSPMRTSPVRPFTSPVRQTSPMRGLGPPANSPVKNTLVPNLGPPARIVSATGSTTSENWEPYDETSSEDDLSSEVEQWRQREQHKLGARRAALEEDRRVSAFNRDKDIF